MKTWYRIEAKKKDKTAKILIYEHIGRSWDGEGVSAKEFVKELQALDVDTIDLHINSPGGHVFEGNAIYNALRAHRAAVTVHVDGVAASIASVIAMAGDTVTMPENAMMMIHDPSGMVIGTAEDMLKMAKALEKVKDTLVIAYRTKSGQEEKKLSDLMTAETWLSAAEAAELGLADEVTGPVTIQNSFDPALFANYGNTPDHVIATAAGPTGDNQNPMEDEDMEITVEFLNEKHKDVVDAIAGEARQAGAEAERQRIQDVLDQSMPGHEDLIQKLAFDGKTTGPEAAVQVLKAQKQIAANAAAALDDDAIDPVPPAIPPEPGTQAAAVADDAPIEEQAKAEWDKDAALRKEFDGDYDQYLAYRKAVDGGAVKVLGKKK